jgi:TonB family protein
MPRWIAIAWLVLCAGMMVEAQEQSDDSPRKLTQQVAPVYPDLARNLNLQGTVKLRVTVAPDGSAKALEILGGNPVLVRAAQNAVMRWKWAPAAREAKENLEIRFPPKIVSSAHSPEQDF